MLFSIVRPSAWDASSSAFAPVTRLFAMRMSLCARRVSVSVLIKADGLPTYNFANVIDDHTMGITHVMRGNEYLSSAPKYNLLYEAFGWTPPTYVHLTPVMCRDIQKDKDGHPVLDENGQTIEITRKMSKRKGDPSFEDLLSQGYLVDAVINYMVLLGWSPRGEREFYTLDELKQAFDLVQRRVHPQALSRGLPRGGHAVV